MEQNSTHPERILRFRKAERVIHWAVAVPFMLCYVTALILVVFYNSEPVRPYRDVFSWIHRISGCNLVILPVIVLLIYRKDFKIHFQNIKQVWVWTFEDVRWLFLIGPSYISKKVKLPEQGKFNAAEKLNFMTLLSTYPLYALTGALIWLYDGALLPWVIHFGMAVVATPLMFGHIFMATINPDTRVGLSGMISGFVDRQWAKHHYTTWYKAAFGDDEQPAEDHRDAVPFQVKETPQIDTGSEDYLIKEEVSPATPADQTDDNIT